MNSLYGLCTRVMKKSQILVPKFLDSVMLVICKHDCTRRATSSMQVSLGCPYQAGMVYACILA
jgi:hypothetical protein